MSIQEAYNEVRNIQGNVDNDDFRDKRKYRKPREQWVASVFMRGIEKLTHAAWKIQMMEEGKDPPDFIAESNEEKAEIEILFVPKESARQFNNNEFSSEVAKFIIDKKIRNKSYPDTYIIVVYGNFAKIGLNLNLIRNIIKNEKPKIGQIWMLACINSLRTKYKIFELFRESQEEAIDVTVDFIAK